MKLLKTLCLTSLVLTSSAYATVEYSGTVGVTTDYIDQGFSQNDRDPAVQAGLEASKGGLFGGVWASQVDGGEEIDLYLGHTSTHSGVDFTIALTRFEYTNGDDFNELNLIGATNLYGADVALQYDRASDYDNYELTYARPVGEGYGVFALLGHKDVDAGKDVTFWNVGASAELAKDLTLSLAYHDTNLGYRTSDSFNLDLTYQF